jgi:hypothetical protein
VRRSAVKDQLKLSGIATRGVKIGIDKILPESADRRRCGVYLPLGTDTIGVRR